MTQPMMPPTTLDAVAGELDLHPDVIRGAIEQAARMGHTPADVIAAEAHRMDHTRPMGKDTP